MERQFAWDFFLAHTGAEKEVAESLYDLLSPTFRVFLDSRCLLPGDDWDRELAQAQSGAAMTLVLVSSRTEKAFYQREEIAAAIDMARRDKDTHRVVPIYLETSQELGDDLPYGLRLSDGGLKMGWTKPLPRAWPMSIDCLPDLGRGSDVARSDCFVGPRCLQ